MKYKRIIYPIVFILVIIIAGYFIFTGCQISEQQESEPESSEVSEP